MPLPRRSRWLLSAFFIYLTLCTIGGIYVADGTLHPARRPLTENEITDFHRIARTLDADLSDASIITPDGALLRAWIVHPHHPSGDAVLLLHGLGDNRIGMTGYAQLLLAHGFSVLVPDARAHGTSGGPLATFGLLERNDIHQWFDFLNVQDHPRCIFALGESMGASQLLQSLETSFDR
jgi:predicted alpha/beta-fold hydrolase